METVITKIVDGYVIFLVFIGLIFFSQMKGGKKSRRKGLATGLWLLESFLVWVAAYLISLGKAPLFALWIVLGVIAFNAVAFHKVLLPYKKTCSDCGKKLSLSELLSYDEHVCHECYVKRHPETVKLTREEQIAIENAKKKVTWEGWEPNRECVIVFPADSESNVLMIDNLELDKVPGKYSGCIGTLRRGEDKQKAARRALREETGLISEEPDYEGRLNFEMPEYNLRCHIFVARDTTGEIKETSKKKPFWTPLKKLKYNLMSMDYPLWVGRAVRGQNFEYWARCNKEGKIYDDLLELDVEI